MEITPLKPNAIDGDNTTEVTIVCIYIKNQARIMTGTSSRHWQAPIKQVNKSELLNIRVYCACSVSNNCHGSIINTRKIKHQ